MKETDTESGAVNPADPPASIVAELRVSESVQVMEEIEWTDVPGIRLSETAAWAARLVEARDDLREDQNRDQHSPAGGIDPIMCPHGHHAVELGAERAWCRTCQNQGLDPNFDIEELRDL